MNRERIGVAMPASSPGGLLNLFSGGEAAAELSMPRL